LESFDKRFKALFAKVAQDGLILTEDQLRALERTRKEKQAHGEIKTNRLVTQAARTPIILAT
jgi:hypothetical protein